MAPLPPNHEKLERFIHEVLCDLPLRRAPHTLERRVLAALEQRARLSWWRQGFTHWPRPARASFLVSAVAAAGLVTAPGWLTPSTVIAPLADVASHLGWLTTARDLLDTFAATTGIVGQAIPPLWLYGALGVVAALYAALFGLGAAAYRTLTTMR